MRRVHFRCATGRSSGKLDGRWNDGSTNSNTVIGDGYVGAEARFGGRAKDSTIIRDYLREYQWHAQEDGSYSTKAMDFTLHKRPGDDEYGLQFTVRLSLDGRWANVEYISYRAGAVK